MGNYPPNPFMTQPAHLPPLTWPHHPSSTNQFASFAASSTNRFSLARPSPLQWCFVGYVIFLFFMGLSLWFVCSWWFGGCGFELPNLVVIFWFWVCDLFVILVVAGWSCRQRRLWQWVLILHWFGFRWFWFCSGLGFLMVMVAWVFWWWWWLAVVVSDELVVFVLEEERYTEKERGRDALIIKKIKK